MEKRLSDFFTDEIAGAAGLLECSNQADALISGIEYDSRKIKPGNIYCAMRGLHTDGHLYIDDAIARGAAAVILEDEIPPQPGGAVFLRVTDSRRALSPVSAAFYGFPSRRLIVIGVTGTEGKSTTVYLIWQLLRLMGQPAGFFSTVQYSLGGAALWNPEHQTTPEANAVQRMLWEMAENGARYAVVEASSHGLSPRTSRLANVDFDAALITNVTHEHLEFHGTWEQYRHDKANLFRGLDRKRVKTGFSDDDPAPSREQPFGVINADDPSAAYFAQATAQRTVTFSVKGAPADLALRSIEPGERGNRYEAYAAAGDETLYIEDRLPGAFNAGNVLAALLTVSGLLDIPLREIAPHVPELKPVRGRMTRIERGQPFEVLVDYAHTPSSFQTIFPPLRERLDKSRGRIITLFGSAGERDTKKRSEQGKIAADYSDIVILTDEDPRGENPMGILEEIAQGCVSSQVCLASAGRTDGACDTPAASGKKPAFTRNENLFLIPDRCAAIRKALSLAHANDLVLLLGKGHENSIIYADGPIPFDEFKEAEKALAEIGY